MEATDASAEQIANAAATPGITYSVQPAEQTNFADATFDAVCVAQAVHWFDIDRFNAEARRVLKPRGVILVTAYDWTRVSPEFDRELERLVLGPIHPLWPPQNTLVMNAYRDVAFPFERIELAPMKIELDWTLGRFLAYIGTWTAMRRMLQADPQFLDRVEGPLAAAWGPGDERTVTMPLHVLCGRV